MHTRLLTMSRPSLQRLPKTRSLLLLSFVYSFLFMPLHECVHETAFKTKWINAAVAETAGFLTLRPPTHYRYYHYAHHRYTGIQVMYTIVGLAHLVNARVRGAWSRAVVRAYL